MIASTLTQQTCVSELDEIDLVGVKIDPALCRCLPASGARRFRVLALCQVRDEVIVATSNSDISAVTRFVSAQFDHPYRLVRADETSLRRLIVQVYPTQRAQRNTQQEHDAGEIVHACDEVVTAAILRGASDIHLMPGDAGLRTRLRVDGVLEDYRTFSVDLQAGMISRIKVLAGLNIAEKREPQDGRIRWTTESTRKKIDIRVATIPTRFGERVSMRLLVPINGLQSLADLGMEASQLSMFQSAIESPNGLILLTGPTGSGKSTTLYAAMMQLLASRGGNVITVEDPIEYEIPGATQVEVDAANKVSFAGALRSVLRHDPDVIMLGEIRDTESAELAIKAALTGHLVFSTLHTNTAAGAVTRLIDMGIAPFLVAATLRLAVAQRLVRRLCPRCRLPSQLSATEAAAFESPQLENQSVYQPAGCVYCAGKGFAGRTALFEMLCGGRDLSNMITKGAVETDLMDHLRRSTGTTLIDDAVCKLLSGATSAKQLLGAVATW